MVPNALFSRARLVRAVALWLSARAILGLAFAFGGVDPVRLRASAALDVIVLAALLLLVDERRQRESVLIANLGISRLWCVVLDVLPALTGEVAMRVWLGGPR